MCTAVWVVSLKVDLHDQCRGSYLCERSSTLTQDPGSRAGPFKDIWVIPALCQDDLPLPEPKGLHPVDTYRYLGEYVENEGQHRHVDLYPLPSKSLLQILRHGYHSSCYVNRYKDPAKSQQCPGSLVERGRKERHMIQHTGTPFSYPVPMDKKRSVRCYAMYLELLSFCPCSELLGRWCVLFFQVAIAFCGLRNHWCGGSEELSDLEKDESICLLLD